MEFNKYRWFYTSSGTLVFGGKNSEQNDLLLTNLKKENKNYTILHTAQPGSPFTVIYTSKPSKKDIQEAAIFTACFSQAWKQKKKSSSIHIFALNQVHKSSEMKSGTWGVLGKVEEITVDLELTLALQNNFLRAIPLVSKKSEIKIVPGNIDKADLIDNVKMIYPNTTQQQLIEALPAGGCRLIK